MKKNIVRLLFDENMNVRRKKVIVRIELVVESYYY